MSAIIFRVPGPVRGQARTGGNGARRFKTKDTANYENRMASEATKAMEGRELMTGPVRLRMTADFMPPATTSAKLRAKMLAGELWPTKKPDADNIMKMIDALKGIVWRDDVQVVRAQIIKQYKATPGLTVEIAEILP